MKNKNHLLSVLFTLALTATLLGCLVARLIYPLTILPRRDVPNVVGLSCIVLVLEHYLAPGAKRSYIAIFLFSALSSALLPWAIGFVAPIAMPQYALSGGIVFTVTTWLFDSLVNRLSTGPAANAAPVLGAMGLFLAAQCFQGMF